ncbi:hypothetical protein [Clostridium sporogenes]|uniref:Uncharacterized protein n=1 Tax=Clostridium sporogenes TaxID=1509 RepID=A0ABX4K148_CLOSG|nr:hypothetical protein [Clostridium sporogenes]PHG98890.1 hypothetical protein CRX47_03165 [Clostridium sporogenes]UBI13451.1 hypothetical protein LA336_07970 [Clostridium sporogenes]
MSCISGEEFLKQDKEVQEVLIKWWREHSNIHDLVTSPTVEFKVYTLEQWGVMYTCIPLLQTHHLIQFIEDRTYKSKLEMTYDLENNNYEFLIKYSNTEGQFIFSNKSGILQALWEVVCKLIKQDNK